MSLPIYCFLVSPQYIYTHIYIYIYISIQLAGGPPFTSIFLGLLWNLHGEIDVLHAIYMGRLSSTHLHGEIARLHGVYMGRLGLEAMSLPLDWLLKAQKVPPLTNSIFL